MGTSALLSLGTRAMFSSYAQLQTTGHNIANVNTEGYSRQRVELETAGGQFTGAGFFGKGVDVATVSRLHDEFLTREAATAGALAKLDETRLEQLERLEQVFPTGENGVGHAAGQMLNAMVDLASRPQDTATREVVLARAREVAARFATAASQLDSLQLGVNQDLRTEVASVNALGSRIAQVNQQIASAIGTGQSPNDLLDQRDQLIAELSGHVQVTTIAADDGTLGVFIGGGQRLVLGNNASQLAITADAFDATRSVVGIVDNGVVRPLPASILGGGSIAGLLRFQNEDLVAARNSIGQMATAFASAVNDQQALGLDLRVPAGAGAPIFAVGAPQALPASGNARDVSGNFLSSLSLTVADASQLVASEYELQAGAVAGSYTLRRLSDGLVRTIASGDSVDGLTITVNAPAPGPTDRFLLQPLTRSANRMQLVLEDPRGVAAASPVTASAAPTNTGTSSVGALRVVSPTINPDLNANVTFTNATGSYAWELRDRVTNALVSSGTGTWTAGNPIALNGFELTLNGVPGAGDQFNVVKTVNPQTNNGNALALAALRDATMVGRTLDTSGNVVGGDTITDAYASAMAGVGVRVQSARAASDISGRVAETAEQLRSSKAGVNLDEEAARLIQYQQCYQAAAKVLQVAQAVFDTLLETAGR